MGSLVWSLPVSADKPDKVGISSQEVLADGWDRVSSTIKNHKISETVISGKRVAEYEQVITSLPETLSDGTTLIDTSWYKVQDDSGQTYYETGPNLFTAKVLEGRVSVQDESGYLVVWNPTITLGKLTFGGGVAKIVNDPINKDYKSNTLQWSWTYGGTLGFGKSSVTRYLRVIEGIIKEYWVLSSNPGVDVTIKLNSEEEKNQSGDVVWMLAYDSKHNLINTLNTDPGTYVIDSAQFVGKTFPVTIDPTVNYASSASDSWARQTEAVYATARTAASADYIYPTFSVGYIGQDFFSGYYLLDRSYLFFNTAAVPDDGVLSGVSVYLFGDSPSPPQDFYISVTSGMPTYPHDPAVVADYNYTYYSTSDTASFHTSNWVAGSYNIVPVNHLEWVNKTGYTKFCLMSSRDISGTTPTTEEYVSFMQSEYGSNQAPKIYITYSIPIYQPAAQVGTVVTKTETTATLSGYLSYDGGEACSVRFQYGPSVAYSSSTSWQAGFTTGQYFYTDLAGLTPGDLYYWRVQATNSAGTYTSSGSTFLTYPYKPTTFSATGGNGNVSLSWGMGEGAQSVVIRRSTVAYPLYPTSDTLIYSGAATSYVDTTAVSGTLYYYSIWSYATEGGLSEYSRYNQQSYATPYSLGDPVVTTNAASAVTTVTATLNMYLNNLGGYASTEVWLDYYKSGDPAWGTSTSTTIKYNPGSYSVGVAGLTNASLYYVRAVGQNTHGTSYGSTGNFTTGAVVVSAPTITTNSATAVQLNSATLNGVVSSDGGASVTVWLEYGLTTAYGSSTPSGSGFITSDPFYYAIGSLTPSTTYHLRAVGQNSAGIGYGLDGNFTTSSPTTPTVRTDTTDEIGANQAKLHGTVLTDGGASCYVRFQHSTTGLFAGEEVSTGWITGYGAGTSFNAVITGLTTSATYYVRAQAKNAGGTGSGSIGNFTTVFTAPTDLRANAINSTTINIDWTRTGDQTYIRYKTNGYPIDRLDGDPVYFGSDETTSLSGLDAGTTYYFTAWSWAEGEVWASGVANDVATTAPVVVGPGQVGNATSPLVAPSWWYRDPSGTILVNFEPFYGTVNRVATAYGMPPGGMWLLVAFVITLCAIIATYFGAGKISEGFSVQGKGMASVIVGLFALFVCSMLGMLSLWYIFPFIVASLGINFAVGRLTQGG